MPKFEILKELEKSHQKKLEELKKRYFSLDDFIELVTKKKSELNEKDFDAWIIRFWNDLDKDNSPYFSIRG